MNVLMTTGKLMILIVWNMLTFPGRMVVTAVLVAVEVPVAIVRICVGALSTLMEQPPMYLRTVFWLT